MKKFVYSFNEGSKDMADLLGCKGANLAEMTKMGLPVPFGFTITTEACNRYLEEDKELSDDIKREIFDKLADLENVTGKKFGEAHDPLLLSVRSGSAFSMPGMLDTVLNIGFNDDIVEKLVSEREEEAGFIYGSYLRLICMYGNTVMGIPRYRFYNVIESEKKKKNCSSVAEFDVDSVKTLIEDIKKLIKDESGEDFQQDVRRQLIETIRSVFNAWDNGRAAAFRAINRIPDGSGIAVSVQYMVFGNRGEDSCTGVAFTRNPVTGEKGVFGEFIINAQGNEITKATRTPIPLSDMKDTFPDIYTKFIKIADILEKHYKCIQNIEFTVENNRLYILQTIDSKNTTAAAVKAAVDMENEGIIDKKAALMSIEPARLVQLLRPVFDKEAVKNEKKIMKGIITSPGAVSGKVYFNAEDIIAAAKRGENTIFVKNEIFISDLKAISVCDGILTSRGGATSHVAIVARSKGKCFITGCTQMIIDEKERKFLIKNLGKTVSEGDHISLDGSTGYVYRGIIDMEEPDLPDEFRAFMKWTDGLRNIKIRANVKDINDLKAAVRYGAEGIDLMDTKDIITDSAGSEDPFGYQKSVFKEILKTCDGMPAAIRLLSPVNSRYDLETVKSAVATQVRAITEAAVEIQAEEGTDAFPELMIPAIGIKDEYRILSGFVTEKVKECFDNGKKDADCLIGAMITTPHAALTADEIAKDADSFAFDMDDLIRMTYGYSKKDIDRYMSNYGKFRSQGCGRANTMDIDGTGKLLKIACELSKSIKPNIKLGVCRDTGSDTEAIEFCSSLGINYISCLVENIPSARLAATQAAIKYHEDVI